MPRIEFTQNLQRHIECEARAVADANSVREALDDYFAATPAVRSYVLDDAGSVRHHIVIFVDGKPIVDREHQSDTVGSGSTILVMQALSGG